MQREAIGVGLIGLGTVGGGVVKLLRDQAAVYAQRAGRPLELRRVLVRNRDKAVARNLVPPECLTTRLEEFLATPGMQVVAEVAGGQGMGDPLRRALAAGKHVVTANKSLLAAQGADLFSTARKHSVSVAFEASCGGGIPIINALLFGLAANRIEALYGILNGTCNYILTAMTQQAKSYATALKEAQDLGFAEADPTLDVSGRDTAEKLAVLAALAFGVRTDPGMVPCEGIDTLDLQDIRFAAELGYDIKLLAIAQRVNGGLSLRVHPSFIHQQHPLAQVHGSFNALGVYGHANGLTTYVGRGAGEMPTASAVVGDILAIASGWYPHAFASMRAWPGSDDPPPRLIAGDDLSSRFYLRINALDRPGTMAQVTAILGESGISISAALQHEAAENQFVPVVIITHLARQGAMHKAKARIQALSVNQGSPVCIRIVDTPAG